MMRCIFVPDDVKENFKGRINDIGYGFTPEQVKGFSQLEGDKNVNCFRAFEKQHSH